MNATFSKKFKTAAKMLNVPIILLLVFMHIMCMTGGLLNEANKQDTFLDIMSGLSFGSFGALGVVTIVNGMFFSFVNNLKVLPFTKKDIKDISLLNIFINIFILTVIQCAITAAMRPSAIPYFICINIVNIAFSIGYLVLMFSDKRMYDPRVAREDPLTRRQNVKLIVVMALGMISIIVLTTFIYRFAARGSLSEDIPMLIITALSAIIISAVEIFLYMRKKIEF